MNGEINGSDISENIKSMVNNLYRLKFVNTAKRINEFLRDYEKENPDVVSTKMILSSIPNKIFDMVPKEPLEWLGLD